MKRRKFLGLFGAVAAAPFMPTVTLAATPARGAAMHGAILHAQTHSAFSVWNLSKALNLPLAQAEALMGELAARGIISPLQGVTYGGRWATSKIQLRGTMTAAKAAQKTKAVADTSNAAPELNTMIAHLRQVCIDYGMPLHPRCALT